MLTSKVAKRYAQGLLNLTEENGFTDRVFVEMKDLANTIGNSRDLQNFFTSPIIDIKKKMAIASEIFKEYSPICQNLILLVIRHGREGQLANIAQAYIDKVEDINGVQRITLTSAKPLSEENIKSILGSTNIVNHHNKFDIKSIIDTDILGGYILRVGDQQIDESVKTKLNRLKKEFQHN